MPPVATLALLSRKDGQSPELFSRYWRDVHGVLAARIPGFASYIQHHLGPPLFPEGLRQLTGSCTSDAPWHGLAAVNFADEAARQGLIHSEVAAMIHEDERNLFKTSLLFNLESAASTLYEGRGRAEVQLVVLVKRAPQLSHTLFTAALNNCLATALAQASAVYSVTLHDLSSGDPSQWNTAGVDHHQVDEHRVDALLQVCGGTIEALCAALEQTVAQPGASLHEVSECWQLYPVDAMWTMVENHRPTSLGLRGLDALRTIEEAGANNQYSPGLLRCLYGAGVVGP